MTLRVILPLAIAAVFAIGAAHPFPALANDRTTPVEIHYAPAENLEKIDVALIREAETSIDMTAYVLTDVAVINALTDAAERGVWIRIYRDARTSESHGAVGEALARLAAQPSVEQHTKHAFVLMHLKSYVVDGKLLRTGSANFSASGEKHQDNDLIVIRDATAARAFVANFETMWGAK